MHQRQHARGQSGAYQCSCMHAQCAVAAMATRTALPAAARPYAVNIAKPPAIERRCQQDSAHEAEPQI